MLTRRKIKLIATVSIAVVCVLELSQQIVYQMVRDSEVYLRTKRMIVESPRVPGLHTNQIRDSYESGFDWSRSSLCPNRGAELTLMIFVMSAPQNQVAREAIRRTWGAYSGILSDISLAFLVGATDNDTIEEDVYLESEQHSDLVVGKFIDCPENSTMKVVSMLEWMEKKCFGAKFLLKINDDVFLNVPQLQAVIQENRQEHRTIFGHLIVDLQPNRNSSVQNFVETAEYDSSLYPFHMAAPAYLLTGDVIHDLFEKSLDTPYFKIENIFITGFVGRELLKLNMQSINKFHYNTDKFRLSFRCFIRDGIVTFPNCTAIEMFDLWEKTFLYDDVDCGAKSAALRETS